MYLGQLQLGDWVPLEVRTVTPSTGIPTLPSNPVNVVAAIWDANGMIETVRLPIKSRYAVTGLFGMDWQLGSRYTTGQYFVFYSWTCGGEAGMEIDRFEILPGGDPDGTIVSCFEMQGPEARYVIQELDSGPIQIGRNAR